MKRQNGMTAQGPEDACAGHQSARARRAALVEEMVRGAILPKLLARKDAGHFDRGANVIRFPARDEA